MKKFIKNIIGKILRYFLTKYRLTFLLGRGKRIYLKFDDTEFLELKENEWKRIEIAYFIKKKKKTIYINGLEVKLGSQT